MDRKFYIYDYDAIQYQWYGLFGFIPDKYYKMMFYEENGKFYEFLTGRFLGNRERCEEHKIEYISSEEFGSPINLRDSYSQRGCARLVTAEQFARKAREYMEEKSKIIPYVNERFDQWRVNHKKNIEQGRLKRRDEEKKKIEDSQNTDWLSNMLDKR